MRQRMLPLGNGVPLRVSRPSVHHSNCNSNLSPPPQTQE
jgi:hypothetical protein